MYDIASSVTFAMTISLFVIRKKKPLAVMNLDTK